MTSTLVSALVSRAEELSSPYVVKVREASPLADKTAKQIAEFAKKYEVEQYVKAADKLAEKAATKTLSRIPESTKARVTAIAAAGVAENLKLVEAYTNSQVDAFAASVVTFVDRLLPEDEEAKFDEKTARANVRAVPRVIRKRGVKASNELVLRTKSMSTAQYERALALAMVQKDKALAATLAGKTHLLDLVEDLKDELDVRTLSARDALAVRRAELRLRYKEALTTYAARRAVAQEYIWAQLRNRSLDVYVLGSQRKLAVFQAETTARINGWRVLAAEKYGDARTIFVERKNQVVSITRTAQDNLIVRVVAVRSALTDQYEETSRLVLTKTEDSRKLAKERTAALIAEARKRTAEQREQLSKLYKQAETIAVVRTTQLREQTKQVQTRAIELVHRAQKEAPAVAGNLTSRVLGEERGQQVEKMAASMLAALPMIPVA